MSEDSVTLAFVGDLMLGRGVSEMAAQYSAESFWGDVLPLLRGCDAVFGNLECPITLNQRHWQRCWKAFRFRAHPRVIELLKAANFHFVNLANNHILDCESDGLLDTMQFLDSAGIAHAGAGRNLEEAKRPRLLEVAGVQVGVISITDTMQEFSASTGQAGTNYLPIRTDTHTLGQIEQTVRKLRLDGARIVVLSAHWGPNLRPWPSARYRRFARAVTELGINIFHGHSAHLIQGIEAREIRLILYDTGDFLDDYWVFPGVRIDRSCLFLVQFVEGQLCKVRLVPVLLERGCVRRAVGKEARTITSHMLRSSIFGSDVVPTMTAELGFGDPAVGLRRCPALALSCAEPRPEQLSLFHVAMLR
jgi:poly-gamma-glutamate synthesis protein (capsule biosynthesis protein)